jgi:D-glycero-alpha-D-manno-heptose-7-phosphate kinase
MILSRTPLRISFAGGGTDLKPFYSRYGGKVLSTTIDKYIYVAVHPYFNNKILLKYSSTEEVDTLDEIQHPLFRESLRLVGITQGVEVTSISDVPSGTGLASSSCFTVGLLHALYTFIGREVTPAFLARQACHIEINVLGEPIGKQDQYAAAYGGLNSFTFYPDESVVAKPLILSPSENVCLSESLMLFYTGLSRDARQVLSKQVSLIPSPSVSSSLLQIMQLTQTMADAIACVDIQSVGELLHKGWVLKRDLHSGISNPAIDDLYSIALKNGALGGKLLGAGGGGFLLLCCLPERQQSVRAALSSLKELPFNLGSHGSEILYPTDKTCARRVV